MTEEFVNEEPATGWGFAIFSNEDISGGSVSVSCPRDRTLPQYWRARGWGLGLGTGKLALAQEECC